ncbi:hypothetical protein C8J57DRAFT_1233093 [Mycena rebaudengoi]|nr:hypothetical protein C8J57DRAFT_1233093 [Mycena rebaudengoi]
MRIVPLAYRLLFHWATFSRKRPKADGDLSWPIQGASLRRSNCGVGAAEVLMTITRGDRRSGILYTWRPDVSLKNLIPTRDFPSHSSPRAQLKSGLPNRSSGGNSQDLTVSNRDATCAEVIAYSLRQRNMDAKTPYGFKYHKTPFSRTSIFCAERQMMDFKSVQATLSYLLIENTGKEPLVTGLLISEFNCGSDAVVGMTPIGQAAASAPKGKAALTPCEKEACLADVPSGRMAIVGWKIVDWIIWALQHSSRAADEVERQNGHEAAGAARSDRSVKFT